MTEIEVICDAYDNCHVTVVTVNPQSYDLVSEFVTSVLVSACVNADDANIVRSMVHNVLVMRGQLPEYQVTYQAYHGTASLWLWP